MKEGVEKHVEAFEAPRPSRLYRHRKEATQLFNPGMIGMDDDDDDDDFLSVLLQSQVEFEGFGPKMKGGFVSSSNSTDKLNLAGVLNVLDGVIDCPGRIVIMTTNHPEMLDPALVCPGRISKKLHLGYMTPAQMEEMIAYYFSTTLTAKQRRRLHELGDSDRVFTPADIEELCAEHDSVDDVIKRLLAHT